MTQPDLFGDSESHQRDLEAKRRAAQHIERVSLEWPEQLHAAQVGSMRRISAINRNRPQPLGEPEKIAAWDKDIESSGAEAAVAKLLGLYWYAVDADPQSIDGDVSGVEVRHTHRPDGRLILHDKDDGDRPFVLVRGVMPAYDVVGWIFGRDGKKQKYLFKGDGRAAYFVPAADLRPIEELKGHVRQDI